MSLAVYAQNLGFLYPNKQGIHDISFRGDEGEILCFLGRNGSGKSTLLRLVSTLVQPQSGSLSVCGKDVREHRDDVRSHVCTVFDDTAHFDFATGRDNLLFFLYAYGNIRSLDIERLREQFELNLSMKVCEYSYGMRRKLCLIEAFLSQRQILLFDEPTLGLDSASRQQFFQRCREEKELGKTIIISTNRLEDAINSDRVLFLEHGNGRELDSIKEVASKLVKVTLTLGREEVTEYIGDSSELPGLIQRYLQVGVINRIDIANTTDALVWSREALEKVQRAPQFLQKMISRVVEEYARKENVSLITPAVVEASRGRFERR